MSPIRWLREPSKLRSPIAVVAFHGAADGGRGASAAVADLAATDSEPTAVINCDDFIDYSEHRPLVKNDHDQRVIAWPDTTISIRSADEVERDVVLIEGIEPQLQWRRFAYLVGEVLAELDVSMTITLSSSVADVPHTRPPTVVGSASDPQLAAKLRLRAQMEHGPATIVGVLHDELDARGLASASLRVAVPHYVAGAVNPAATQALLERLERVTGIVTHWVDHSIDVEAWRSDVDAAVKEDPEVVEYVAALEAAFDEAAASAVPDADDLAADFERFLRQQDQ